MNSQIKIKALSIDEDECDFTKFRMFFDNGLASASFEFYHYLDCFAELASKLESFPENANDLIVFEIGEDSKNWAYHLIIKINCEPNGNSAIHIKLDNRLDDVDLIKSEFFIKSVPASLNKFGKLLKSWNAKEKSEVIWTVEN